MKKIFVTFITLILLVGCSAPKAATKEKIEITHKLGTTEVETNPDKVFVFDMGIVDIMKTLELNIGGVPVEALPTPLKDVNKEGIVNIGSLFEPDFEKIAEEAPNLIIVSGRSSKHYEQLSEIAPTIYMGSDVSSEGLLASINKNVETFGLIFPDTNFDKATASLEAAIKEVHDKAEKSGYNTLFLMANGNEIRAFGPGSRYDHVFTTFGFKSVADNIEESTHGSGLSYELIQSLNPDVIIVMDRGAIVKGDKTAEELMDNAFVKETEAAKNNRIIYVDPQNWYLTEGGIQSVLSMSKELNNLFAQ